MMALCSIATALGVMGWVVVAKRLLFRRRFGGRGPWALAACGPSLAGWGAGCRGRWADEGHGAWGGPRWRGGGGLGRPGGSFWLRAVFARLDTTPGQEREIRAAIEDLQSTFRATRDGLHGAREDVARAIRAEVFDGAAVSEAGGRVDAAASTMKSALSAALERIHGVLDPKQRERFAELIASGHGFGPRRWRGPYRDAAF